MLRRDYFLRLLHDVFAAIASILRSDAAISDRQSEIESLYTIFGHTADFFRTADPDELVMAVASSAAEANLCSISAVSQDEMAKRLELLAALMYADAKVSSLSDSLRADVSSRSLYLYQRVDALSDDFSLERIERINELKIV